MSDPPLTRPVDRARDFPRQLNKERSAIPVETRVEALLWAPEDVGNPLRETLADLYLEYTGTLERLEQLVQISDGYHAAGRTEVRTLAERFEHAQRVLDKATRISDLYQRMLAEMNIGFKHMATHDAMTHLWNRRYIETTIGNEMVRADRGHQPFALLLLDVDNFKLVNDTYGHAAGDRALVALANELLVERRAYDVVARWGGEEFLILLPEITRDYALELAERTRERVAALRIALVEGEAVEGATLLRITVSIGVVCHHHDEDIDALLSRADRALYAAKDAGRDCVCLG